MLVAGNDRVQTIITQLEDSSRVTKVRGPRGWKPPGQPSLWGEGSPRAVTQGWGLQPGVFKQGWWGGTDSSSNPRIQQMFLEHSCVPGPANSPRFGVGNKTAPHPTQNSQGFIF